ncbi:type III-B CRISPR module-associated protein Cmr5 [Nocardiopsis alba]|uniref:type III-B CRISPR module-associated protein Cmr5 n=1 Tax=Nocardiopsis alba TaxID=53437 RepID=UPI0036716489
MSRPKHPVSRVDQAAAGIAFRILGEQVNRELRTRMRQLPMRLRGSGLAATYAFVLSKADPRGDRLAQAYHRLAAHVAEQIADRQLLSGTSRKMTPHEFLRALSEADVHDYARVSVEVEILAVWLSRLAEALCEETEENGSTGEGGERGRDS